MDPTPWPRVAVTPGIAPGPTRFADRAQNRMRASSIALRTPGMAMICRTDHRTLASTAAMSAAGPSANWGSSSPGPVGSAASAPRCCPVARPSPPLFESGFDRSAALVAEDDEELGAEVRPGELHAAQDAAGDDVARHPDHEEIAEPLIEDQLGRDQRIAAAQNDRQRFRFLAPNDVARITPDGAGSICPPQIFDSPPSTVAVPRASP
jgi:hypothetical protein